MGRKKVSDEVIKESYERLSNVWKVGKEVGLCGQSVHERVIKLGISSGMNFFSEKDINYLKKHYVKYRDSGTLDKLAKKMNRTKQFICRNARKLGLTDTNHDKKYLRNSKPSYHSMHYDVRKLRGKPKKCMVCGTDDKNKWYDWANLTGKYDDPNDYKRMCRKCHRAYDNKRRLNND